MGGTPVANAYNAETGEVKIESVTGVVVITVATEYVPNVFEVTP